MVERGPLKGREQEWNISRKELAELVCPIRPACIPACDGHGKVSNALKEKQPHRQAGPRYGYTWNCKVAMQVEEGVLTREEAEECIGIEFNPVRAGFHGGQDVWTRDVLNLGVRPDKAIAKVPVIWNLLRYSA